MSIKEKELPDKTSRQPDLVTLLLGDHDVDIQKDSRSRVFGSFDDLFKFLPQLRVLDLSRTDITCLPTSVSCLVNLNYLNISHTDISSLPLELNKLRNLRQLNLRNTPHLTDIPYRAICSFKKNLKTLNLYCSSYKWSHKKGEMQIRLESLLTFKLQELGINMKVVQDLAVLLRSPLRRSVTFLSLDEMSSLAKDSLELSFSSMSNLQQVYISSCSTLTELTFPCEKLQALQVLFLKGLPLSRIATQPASANHFLPCLHRLHISQCHQLEEF
ncbi:hypothetical protein Taro_012888 [Colocasia esculenta]|uniref:Disease resistance R13L4/SHOC-2-like LRR domain-containing protein n=1 Tax=Colocasia esculenta TaxID=4460 RepID=A0A843UEQ6_COLES|nr:hypothetical protein [Colocasia esculenta]